MSCLTVALRVCPLGAAVEASMRLAVFDLYVPISATFRLPSRKNVCLWYQDTNFLVFAQISACGPIF